MADPVQTVPAPAAISSPAASAVTAAPTTVVADSPAATVASPSPTPPVSSSPAVIVPHETIPAQVPEQKPAEVAPVETKPEAAPAPVVAEKSLLGDQIQKPAEKPVEQPAEVKPAEPVKVEAIKYEAFKLPDGITLPEADLGKYTAILGEHQVPQAAAQQLVDLYVAERQREIQAQHDTWLRTREGWVNEFKADGEIGGNRQDTTLKRVGAVMEQYAQAVGVERADKLKQVLGFTGAGDNPEMVRFVNWAAGFTVERSRAVAATVPKAPLPTSRAQRRYANPAFSTGAT